MYTFHIFLLKTLFSIILQLYGIKSCLISTINTMHDKNINIILGKFLFFIFFIFLNMELTLMNFHEHKALTSQSI
jgi:hypothetical protein